MKASLNGPNRRKNRVGDKTVASYFDTKSHPADIADGGSGSLTTLAIINAIPFRVKSLEKFIEQRNSSRISGSRSGSSSTSCSSQNEQQSFLNKEYIGDACLFTLKTSSCHGGEQRSENRKSPSSMCSGDILLQQHFQMINQETSRKITLQADSSSIHSNNVMKSDPILIHFHEIPILTLRAIPINIDQHHNHSTASISQDTSESGANVDSLHNNDCNIIYLSQVHCHNHKICEDTVYTIKCCSRIMVEHPISSPAISIPTKYDQIQCKNYDNLSAIGFEVFLRYDKNDRNAIGDSDSESKSESESERDCQTKNDSKSSTIKEEFQAKDLAKLLINHCLHSVLTVNECLVITCQNKELVCRVSKVCIDKKRMMEGIEEDENNVDQVISAADASLDDPYRGRVTISTDFYVETSNPDVVRIHGGETLPEGSLPEDVIHITTSDDEWFPVRRILLAPCIQLTKYVQRGKGIYKNNLEDSNSEKDKLTHSPDAPESGIHCRVDIDCCTFDRVLVFIMSQLYPNEYKFALELSELNALSHAAQELGLLSLSDLCKSQLSSFASRVRKDKYIRFNEIEKRNQNNELLIIIDGMVLDITRWIDEHPGGPSIIPSQALNIDCTCFFEMYHISSASFLYLKSFYIGELHPSTQLKKSDIKPSDGFMQSLRSYTDQWRVKVDEKVGETIHKSL